MVDTTIRVISHPIQQIQPNLSKKVLPKFQKLNLDISIFDSCQKNCHYVFVSKRVVWLCNLQKMLE